MAKRLLYGILVFAMLFSCITVTYADEGDVDTVSVIKKYTDKYTSVLSMNFEKDSIEFDNRKTADYAKQIDSKNQVSITMPQASSWKTFDEAIDKGVVLINYDFNLPTKGSLHYVRLLSSSFVTANAANDPHMVETFGYNVNGKVGFYPNSTGWTLNAKENISLNEWHNASIWAELDSGRVFYCYDNKFIGETTFNANELVDLNGVLFSYDNRTGSGLYLDNIEVIKLDRTIFPELVKEGVNVPDALLKTVNVSASVGGIGNSVFEKNKEIPAKVSVYNKLSISQELKVNILARSRKGVGFFEKEEVMTIDPESTKQLEFTIPGVSEYGYYDLYVDIYGAKDGEKKEESHYEFALVKSPPEGTRNPKTSIINHVRIPRMGDSLINLEMIDKAGFSAARSEVSWNLYEAVAGVKSLPENYVREVQERKNRNIKHLEIIAYDNKALGIGNPPVSDEELKLFSQFAVDVIGDLIEVYGDNIEVEIWNEYNNTPGHFNEIGATPEDYAKMLKYTYPAIKAKYPDVFVWGLNMYKIDNAWAERVFAAGGLDYMDGISLHPYNSNATPDSGGQIALTRELKEIIKKYTDKDIKLLATEWGFTSMDYGPYPSNINQGSYIVRQQVLNNAYDLYESIYWYTANDGGDMKNSLEYNFGLMRGPETKIPYGVKPSYLSISNFNSFMVNASFVDMTDIGDDVKAYRFKLADEQDCLVMWKENAGYEMCAADLGTDSVRMMDMYGNEKILSTLSGSFNLRVGTTPVYLIGDFDKCEKAEPKFKLSNEKIEIASGEQTVLHIYQYGDKKGNVEVVGNDDIKIKNNSGFKGDMSSLLLESAGNPVRENDDGKYGEIEINVYDGEKLIFTTPMEITYVPRVDIKVIARPHDTENTGWWQLVTEIVNRSLTENMEISFNIDEPEILKKNVGEIKMNVAPNMTKRTKINLPEELINDKKIKFRAKAGFADGEIYEIDREVMLYSCVNAPQILKIDGKMEQGEWNEGAALTPSEGKYIYLTGNSYGGAEDISGTIYTAWDSENFYLGAKVTDDVLSDDTTHGGVFWRSDGIQIAFSPYKGSTEISQLDLAQIKGENRLTVEKNLVKEAIGEVDKEKFDFELSRDGNITTYEARIPWDVIFPNGYKAEKNGELAITLLINDNDGDQREGYYEYGSGMGSGSSNSEEYNLFFMLGKALIDDLK